VPRICKPGACAAAVLLSVLLTGAGLRADRVPETYKLLLGPLDGGVLAQATLYAVRSNAVLQSPLTSATWTPTGAMPALEADERIRTFVTLPNQPLVLYLLTSHNIYISSDAGASWLKRTLAPLGRAVTALCVDSEQDTIMLLGTTDGVWRSRDGGNTFQRFFARVNPTENHILAIAASRYNERVYIATRGGTFVSIDRGSTFAVIAGLPETPTTHIAVSPLQATTLAFVSGGRLFYSENALQSFRLVSSIYDFSECLQLAIVPNGRDIVWSYVGGLLWGKDWLTPATIAAPVAAAPLPLPAPAPVITPAAAPPAAALAPTAAVAAAAILDREAQELRYDRAMQRIQLEPSARDVVDAAIEYAQLHPDRIRTWLRNVKRAALMPQVRILGRGDRAQGLDEGIDAVGTLDTAAYHGRKIGSDTVGVGGEAEMTWDLEKIFFDPNEIGIDERRQRQTELRADVANTVTIYYFQRRNLLFQKLYEPPKDFLELSRLDFQIEELTTKIDTLSGGYFSQTLQENLKKAGIKPTTPPARAGSTPRQP
jgi:hypothetical protein